MGAAEPIRDAELAGLFAKALTFPIALAVSGGPDSVALLLLVHRWMGQSGIPVKSVDGRDNVIVLTVDHGLRPESADESRLVGDIARKHGFRHETLRWAGEKPATGIQAAAREARYRLMQNFVAEESGAKRAIVTAHHQDDQAETLLMRLARGSGLDGLAGMRARAEAHGLTLIRPLLAVPKERLVATLESAAQAWIVDPTNASDRFERVRWRNARPALAALGLDNDHVALSARRLARAREALEAATDEFARRVRLDVHAGAFASLDTQIFRGGPEELRVRLMTRLLSGFGGQPGPPSLARLEELCERLQSSSAVTSTLGGCIVGCDGASIEVCREMGREALPIVELRAGQQKRWDGRFTVAFHGCDGLDMVSVGELGEAGWREIRDGLQSQGNLTSRAAPTLPAFRADGRIVSVPQLGFHVCHSGRQPCTALFIWPTEGPVWPNS